MGRKIKPRTKIVQRSVGFNFYQHEFFNEYPDFKPDAFCREAINEQIKLIAPEFIPEKE